MRGHFSMLMGKHKRRIYSKMTWWQCIIFQPFGPITTSYNLHSDRPKIICTHSFTASLHSTPLHSTTLYFTLFSDINIIVMCVGFFFFFILYVFLIVYLIYLLALSHSNTIPCLNCSALLVDLFSQFFFSVLVSFRKIAKYEWIRHYLFLTLENMCMCMS